MLRKGQKSRAVLQTHRAIACGEVFPNQNWSNGSTDFRSFDPSDGPKESAAAVCAVKTRHAATAAGSAKRNKNGARSRS
jgi:hypothetical protein